ncbi:hypothetical protein EKE94_17440 [Mesobaculum littorinae]|uniref:LPS-assembly lipoprotein n=1 Tax=Mesobaculum littorinae TaxID=2486419 RepID=A0A438ADA4_9RHOB|nr:LPS assembly lipoprotein LptE [Mesobaculum littorinae]RVV96664.1 hypothetical protein EKE94_17440 [Mesobaculum littorinae]
MSWSDRRSLLRGGAAAGAAALLGACGFRPAYGPGGASEGLRGAIAVDPPDDPEGYVLVQRLEERLGLPQAPQYRLAADIYVGEDGLGVSPDQEITRYQVLGRVTYRLTRSSDGALVSSGEVESFTGYSAPVFDAARGTSAGNPVSVQTARTAARERLMVILADRLTQRLLATAADWRA